MSESPRLPDDDSGPVAFVFHDPLEFHCARALLEREGLVSQYRQPGGNLGAYGLAYGLPPTLGTLWVGPGDVDRSAQLLEEAGLPAAFNVPPLVDRREPVCPCCEVSLDPAGAEQCPQCRCRFQWFEMDESAKAWRMEICHQCGYDLRGITSARCPECGADILISAELGVGTNAGAPSPIRSAGRFVRRSRVFWIGLIVFLMSCPCLSLVLLPIEVLASDDPQTRIAAGFVLAVLIVLGVLIGRGVLARD